MHPLFNAADDSSDRPERSGRRRGPGRRGPGAGGFGPGMPPGFGPEMPGGPGGGGPGGGGPGAGGPGGGGAGAGGPGPRGRRGGHFGRPGGWQQADLPSADDAPAWFAGRLPDGWFVGAPTVTVDREEIIVVGELPPVDSARSDASTSEGVAAEGAAAKGVDAKGAAAEGRIARFREETRAQRMAIAEAAQARYGRKVSWGASLGERSELFAHLAVPVMTRLRQPQRQVLDTLVDAGVARSRSDALAWAVSLVGQHTEAWLAELRTKMVEVDKLRAEGPKL